MSHRPSGTSLAAEDLLRTRLPNIVLAGPPGSGKSAVGRWLGEQLGREFVDTDAIVERMGGKPISRIFEQDGEQAFRKMESEACRQAAEPAGRVIALGGGTLCDDGNRRLLEAGGSLVCLTAEHGVLLERLGTDGSRPLLAGGDRAERLQALMTARADSYRSIAHQMDTTGLTIADVADRIAHSPLARPMVRLAARSPSPGYPVVLGEGLLSGLTGWLREADLSPPFLAVSDARVAALYESPTRRALECSFVSVAAGEEHKSEATLSQLYTAFTEAGMDRYGTVVALGGGVLLDLAGFAAATYMRGIRWAALPTSLLGMVDAGLGGKVGINLQAGKNLIGAFHAPSIVLADLSTLSTLPPAETRIGLAEIVKAALIGDEDLFSRMESGPLWITRDWIRRAMQVKLSIVDQDPEERGRRAVLNLGHTFAHALEAASDYRLPHGQAVAVGLLGAARLARAVDHCQADLPDRVRQVLLRFGLPIGCPGLNGDRILDAMRRDKKRRAGRLRFVLPVRPGQVEFGIEVPEARVREIVDGLRETR